MVRMLKFREFWYKSSDGLNLYVRDYSAQCKNKDTQSAIFCLHGLTRNSADYEAFCERYCSDYPVYALDVRGRGQSEYDSNPMNYHVFTYAADVKQLFDQLQLDSVTLIGTSMGGFISMVFAASAPDRVKAIVLNDVGPEVNAEGLKRITNYISDRPAVENWEDAVRETRRINGSHYPDFNDEDWMRFSQRLYREDNAGVPLLDYDEHIADLFKLAKPDDAPIDFWPAFRQLAHIPLLVIRGELSDILDQACVDKMKNEHKSMVYVELPNRGHTPLLNEPTCQRQLDMFFAGL